MTVAATATRRRTRSSVADRLPAFGLGLFVAPVLAANGGYSPTSWGWSAAVLSGAVVVAAAFRGLSRPSRLELLFIGGFLAFAVWEAVAMAWTQDVSQTPLEVERTLVYVAAALAAAALVRRRHATDLLGGVLAGASIVCAYALATRLFPDHFTQSTLGLGRLYRPVGYWNGLGLVATMGALLALPFAARARSRIGRACAGAVVPVLLCTLYLTFSRGALLALVLGVIVLVAFDMRRLQLIAVSAGPAVLSAITVGVASTELSRASSGTGKAHFVAAVVVVAAILAGWAVHFTRRAERSVKLRSPQRRVIAWTLVAATVIALAAFFAVAGSPWSLAHRAYHSISSNPPNAQGDLNKRIFSLSSNGRLAEWRVAIHSFDAHPLAGAGPGSYEELWFQHRPAVWKVRDAHSLYLETLAETGLVGILLLGAALIAPFVGFARARGEPLAAGALAVWLAYLAHAAVDWDWEMTGVTLVAVLTGGALLALARTDERPPMRRGPVIAVASLIGLAALYGLTGNLAMSASHTYALDGNYAGAASEARRAQTLAPWSAQPWRLLGEAQLGLGQRSAARASFATAVSKSRRDWELWLDVARASTGRVRTEAVANARRLNPRDPVVAVVARELSTRRG